MAYFLVMGGLALSVCFTLGWGLWRGTRWLVGRLGGEPRRPRRQTPSKRPAARSSRRRPAAKPAARSAPSPWRLTRALAPLGSAWPLGLVTLLLYGGSLLAAHGMAARPRPAPGAFLRLVELLGWTAAGLLGVSLVGLVAAWRCRR